MSEPELAYKSGVNDDFDLPRWQTQSAHVPSDLIPSSQSSHSAANPSYLYPVSPPPAQTSSSASSRNRAVQHSPSSSITRQPRITQLLEDDPPLSTNLPYLSPSRNQLPRSTFLGASSARARRHHMPDDLEGAYSTANTNSSSKQRQQTNSFYNSSVAYQTTSFGTNATDSTRNP
jgi:hypothetical protein